MKRAGISWQEQKRGRLWTGMQRGMSGSIPWDAGAEVSLQPLLPAQWRHGPVHPNAIRIQGKICHHAPCAHTMS